MSRHSVPLTYFTLCANIRSMDTNSMHQPQKDVAKESSSLLSQVTLHFEYNKTIPQERAALSGRLSSSKK